MAKNEKALEGLDLPKPFVLHDEGMIPKKAMLRHPARSSRQVECQLSAQSVRTSKCYGGGSGFNASTSSFGAIRRGKPINKLLEDNPRLEIIFFPTASPDLNPQEHVWKAVRKEVSHNHLEARLPQLADRFFNQLNSSTFKSSFLDRYGYTAICPMFN